MLFFYGKCLFLLSIRCIFSIETLACSKKNGLAKGGPSYFQRQIDADAVVVFYCKGRRYIVANRLTFVATSPNVNWSIVVASSSSHIDMCITPCSTSGHVCFFLLFLKRENNERETIKKQTKTTENLRNMCCLRKRRRRRRCPCYLYSLVTETPPRRTTLSLFVTSFDSLETRLLLSNSFYIFRGRVRKFHFPLCTSSFITISMKMR